MRLLKIVLMIAILTSIPMSIFAQDTKVTYKKKTEIDFEDLNIDGAIKKPYGSYVLDKRSSSFNPLIRLKENWNKEILDSVNEIR